MKTYDLFPVSICCMVGYLVVGVAGGMCRAQTTQFPSLGSVAGTNYSIVQRGPHSRVWQRGLLQTNATGIVRTNVQSYTELATGLCYLKNGEYVDSVEEIEVTGTDAQAVKGPQKVHWAANANTIGAVQVTSPIGQHFSSRVYGLCYRDASAATNVLIAPLQNSVGVVVSNRVIYTNAFSGISADLEYIYKRGGLEQNVVLREQPPSPADFNLNPRTTWLEVITEFYTPPSPTIRSVTNNEEGDDRTIRFEDMLMGQGTAFRTGNTADGHGFKVAKHWMRQDNGNVFLIEEVPYTVLSNLVGTLPLHSSNAKPIETIHRTASLKAPKQTPSASSIAAVRMKFAEGDLPVSQKSGLVIDYTLNGYDASGSDFIFQGDTTYLISGQWYYFGEPGTVRFEGGSVIKYSDGGTIFNYGSSAGVFEGSAYSPSVFTSWEDDSVGTTISGSSGSPWYVPSTTYYVEEGGDGSSVNNVSNVRFCYADYGYTDYSDPAFSFRDCQFVDCISVTFTPSGRSVSFKNNLCVNCYNIFSGYGGPEVIDAENITVDSCVAFALTSSWWGPCSYSGGITNSILMACDDSTLYFNTDHTVVSSSATGIYQSAGAGNYYLADNSPYRRAGTVNIDPTLLAELQTLTTYPPQVYPNTPITGAVEIAPQAQLDTAGLDLGYHYQKIDYLIDGLDVNGGSLTVDSGTVLATYGAGDPEFGMGFLVEEGANVNFSGTATLPVYLVKYNVIQEEMETGWQNQVLGEPNRVNVASTGTFSFTVFSSLAGDSLIFSDGRLPQGLSVFTFQNCQFYSGDVTTWAATFCMENSLFRRIALDFDDTDAAETSGNTSVNGTFLGGNISMRENDGYWVFEDNLFDNTVMGGYPDVADYNGYITGCDVFSGEGPHDVILPASPAYQVGPLGNTYYPPDSPLLYAGSESAAALGLAFFTVLADNQIDGANMVSIGYHYLAVGVGANGQPVYNNLPAWWQMEYFGVIGLDPNADFDGTGATITQDYQENVDPNVIGFTLSATSKYVNSANPVVQVNINAGVPFYVATLVDDDNFSGASWNQYTSANVMVPLGAQGWHQIWIGLRGLPQSGQQTWQSIRLNLDTTPPVLIVTNPTSTTVSRPIIELQGWCAEPLRQISYDLANSAGTVTGQPMFVLNQTYNPSSQSLTVNSFQGFDIPLTPGVNTVTLHATDLAGNTSTQVINYTLNYSGDTTPPNITMFWPQNGDTITGSEFSLRGKLDNFTATLTAQIVDSSGNSHSVTGVVERNGQFWIENAPLSSGVNQITLSAVDAVGNTSSTSLTVTDLDSALTIDDFTDELGNLPRNVLPQVTGTVGISGYTLWVNGVQATQSGGQWQANSVPLSSGGTAVVEVRAVPDSANSGNGTGTIPAYDGTPGNPTSAASIAAEMEIDQPTIIYLNQVHFSWSDSDAAGGSQDWTYLNGGTGDYYGTVSDYLGQYTYQFAMTWPPAESLGNTPEVGVVYTDSRGGYGAGEWSPNDALIWEESGGYWWQTFEAEGFTSEMNQNGTGTQSLSSSVTLQTGGKGVPGVQMILVLSVTAAADPGTTGPGLATSTAQYQVGTPIPPGALTVMGKSPGSDGVLYTVVMPNETLDATVQAQAQKYEYSVSGLTYTPQITANTIILAPPTPTPTFCVGQQITFGLTGTPPFVNASVNWTLPAKYINEWQSQGNGSPNYDINLNLQRYVTTSAINTTCWYVNGNGGSASVFVTYYFSNGQEVSATTSGAFQIYRPAVVSWNYFYLGPPLVIVANGLLEAGDPVNNINGMSFIANIGSLYAGTAGFTQLISGDFASGILTTLSGYELDKSEWPRDQFQIYTQIPSPVYWDDEPNVSLPLTSSYAAMSLNFNTYLRFRPNAGNPSDNIFVTLDLLNWSVTASATDTSGIGWLVDAGSSISGPTTQESDQFPVWTQTFSP